MRRLPLALAALLVCACGGGPTVTDYVDDGRADPATHLRALQVVAERSDGNRAAGTDGDRRTVAYVERTLRAAGWQVTRQQVRFPFFDLRSPPRLGGLRPAREVRAAEYSGSGAFRARVRRLTGSGCTPADFAGLPRGEIALVDRGTCFFAQKARNAAGAGAGALVIDDVHGRTPVSATLIRPGIRIPVLVVTDAAADRIEGRRVRVEVDAVSERRTTVNVLADSPGGGPRRLVAGAHHDSVSAGPGLNDNGSGVAALLAIADRLQGTPGLRLAFWGAEELALYGSRHYVRSLSPPERRAIRGYVNLDMVASPNARVSVYDRDDRIERALREALPGDEDEVGLEGASDHAPFERAGIPTGGLFTGASARGRDPGPADPCYHRVCDTLGHVDVGLARRMTRAAQRALVELAR